MAFRRVRRNRIESDEGFSVEITGEGLVYAEGDKKAVFKPEFILNPIYLRVQLAEYSDCWDPPHETVRILDEHWRTIADNIRAAYRSTGREVDVHIVPAEVRDRVLTCRKKTPNLIESDAGFSIERVDDSTIRYREGNRQTTCTVGYGTCRDIGTVFLAEASDFWDPPFDTVKISEDDWRRIGYNIRGAYRSQGITMQTHLWPPETRQRLRLHRLPR